MSMTRWLGSLSVLALLGALSAGCSGGSSGGGSGGSTVPTGGLAGSLPVADRNASGYDFASAQVGGTAVTALGVAPTGTESLAIYEPTHTAVRLTGAGPVSEGQLIAAARGIASTNSGVFAATGQVGAAGAGEVYQRGQAGWTIALDSPHELMSVGTLNGSLVAAGGTPGGNSTVYAVGSTSLTAVAQLDSAAATAVAGYRNAIYVGVGPSDPIAGAAGLYRVDSGTATALPLPASFSGATVRSHVTAFESIPTLASTNPTQSSFLLIAGGAWDTTTGDVVGGFVAVTDGDTVEILASWNGEAPLTLAVADSTIYAGLSSGRLVYRSGNGSWQAETSLPANSGVHSLLTRGTSLLVGLAAPTGGAVLTRTASAAPAPAPSPGTSPAPSPAPVSAEQRYFDPHVRLVLQGACVACHSVGLTDAFNAFPLARLPDDDLSFNGAVARSDLANPASSLILQKATGQVAHGGGAVIETTSVSYDYLINWIRQGARRSATVSQFKTYLADIRPLLLKNNCAACHSGRAYRVSGDEVDNHAEVVQFSDANNPANSEFLRRNDGGLNHAGGAPWPVGNADRATIIQWIQDGLRYN